jgi:hypothetical protein
MYGSITNMQSGVTPPPKAATLYDRICELEAHASKAEAYANHLNERLAFLESTIGTRLPEQAAPTQYPQTIGVAVQ